VCASRGWPLSSGVSVAFALPAAVAVVALGLSGRLPSQNSLPVVGRSS
jgi:hypothetical protein